MTFEGKYFSMWRVARTIDAHAKSSQTIENNNIKASVGAKTNNWRETVPTNAFQSTLSDGITIPTVSSRVLAFILPMPQLFRAGVIASIFGYGLTSLLIRARALILPHFVVTTEPVPVLPVAMYTGLFMAFVSNIRYQILQGVVEPYLHYITEANNVGPGISVVAVLLVRYANGVFGSWLAIGGMRAAGLQKLKG
jgi:hypothetical protein